MEIPVIDPFGITQDEKMPFLAQALNPVHVQRQLDQHLTPGTGDVNFISLRAIRVARYKPERRCLIEYDVVTKGRRTGIRNGTYLGKARAKGLDRSTFQVLESLWQNGFSDTSQDGISVPEPVGFIPEFQMWLQRKMPGATATKALTSSVGVNLARQIAEVAHKLHQSGIAIDRSHSISDEMDILYERLERVARLRPRWEGRLNRVLDACSSLASSFQAPLLTGIHRDFYADQVLMHGSRLFILDLDLYCRGDPALDIGNFIGHITEYGLRNLAHADALKDREQAIENRFVELAGESTRVRVRAFALLTLVRHIYLSTQFPERQAFTQPILELCEERLANLLT